MWQWPYNGDQSTRISLLAIGMTFAIGNVRQKNKDKDSQSWKEVLMVVYWLNGLLMVII